MVAEGISVLTAQFAKARNYPEIWQWLLIK
jgi:hypothetical protein